MPETATNRWNRGSGDRFCRYEFKYRLPRGLAAPIRAFVAAHLEHDRYSAAAPDREYTICSLYLDSADLRLCRESLSGQKNRFKLRIRGYDDEPASPVFLEIKRRLNAVILKDRCAVARDDLARRLAPGAHVTGAANEDAARQFRLYRDCLAASPQALVRYRREAFESGDPTRLRVTLDRDVECRLTHDWDVCVRRGAWQPVLPDVVVLEIKFNSWFPAWVQELIHAFQLEAQSVSKYALSLRAGTPAAHGLLAAAAKG